MVVGYTFTVSPSLFLWINTQDPFSSVGGHIKDLYHYKNDRTVSMYSNKRIQLYKKTCFQTGFFNRFQSKIKSQIPHQIFPVSKPPQYILTDI